MLRYLRGGGRGFAALTRAARGRPWLTLAVLGTVLAAGVLAGIGYVTAQWRAAQAALAEDRPADARSHLTVCLFVWPEDPDVRLLAARAARLSGDLSAAESHLNRCLHLHGGATQAVQVEFLLLRAQTGEADKEEVFRPLSDAVDQGHPEAPLILETLARAYMNRLRYRPAYGSLSEWIKRYPDAVKAYHLRGWVLERMNQPKHAAEDYQRALELDPDLIPVRLRVAEMLLEDKRVPEALPHLERLHRQAPDHPEVQARLGICRLFQNRTAEARRLMEAAVVHLPKDPSLLIHLAMLDVQEGRGAEAERRLRTVLEADPSDAEALYNLASALQVQNRPGEAAAALTEYKRCKDLVDRANKMLQQVADMPTAKAADYAEIGALLLRIGRDKLGVYWLGQALERDPAHQPAHKALAEYFDRKGDRDQAAAHRRWLRPGEESKVRGQESGVRGQESGVKGKDSGVKGQGPARANVQP